MRIESGFARFQQDETMNVTVHGIKYTKENHRPFAVCEDINGERFNVNISDKDKKLLKGRYSIHCTSVSDTGYPYVEFKQLQHASWDKRDELVDHKPTPRGNVGDGATIIAVVKSLKNAQKELENIKSQNCRNMTMEYINEALDELYLEYGKHMLGG